MSPAPMCTPPEERFEVVCPRTMKFRMNGKRIVAGPGETVVVPMPARGTSSPTAATRRSRSASRSTPAMKMEDLLENTIALATEGKTNRNGMPTPVHLALFVREYEQEVRAPFPPPAVVAGADGPARRLRPQPWPATSVTRRRRPLCGRSPSPPEPLPVRRRGPGAAGRAPHRRPGFVTRTRRSPAAGAGAAPAAASSGPSPPRRRA